MNEDPEGSEPRPGPRINRRQLFAGAGGVALSTSALATAEAARPVAFRGPDSVPVMLEVNGSKRIVRVEPRTTLAEALRGPLDLTGTKIVCDRGSCSACTVLVDGNPVSACMMLALDAEACSVRTIEGLASDRGLHPVQATFVEHDAMQCGYCTPGMIMSAVALLERELRPNLDTIKAAVSGNLCRCGTYPKVFSAVLAAAERTSSPQAHGGGKPGSNERSNESHGER